MNETSEALFYRSPDGAPARLEVAGAEFRVSAWAVLDGQFDLLEIADEQAALLRLQQLLSRSHECRLHTEGGALRTIRHRPDKRAHWSIEPVTGEALAIACYFSAPPGRMALDAEFALPGAEHAASAVEAIRPLSLVIDPGREPMLMIAGPQHLPADEDESLLAHTFCGLLRDCHQVPVPEGDALQRLLWRELTTPPEEATPLRAPERVVGPRGVVNVHGEEIEDRAALKADWRERPNQQPVRRCASGGVRCWRLSRSLRGRVNGVLRAVARTPEWAALVGTTAQAA